MNFIWLLVAALGVWRLTHFLVAEDGPWRVAASLRQRAGNGLFGELLGCFYCLSLWIAVPFALLAGDTMLERVLLWPALSGAAILLERATADHAAPALYLEEKEDGDGMLR